MSKLTQISFLFWCFISLPLVMFAQRKPQLPPSTPPPSVAVPLPTTGIVTDTTIVTNTITDVRYSKDSLDAIVEYSADFERLDAVNKRVLLVGNAKVTYTSIKLEADSIVFDFDANEVLAVSRRDSLGEWLALPKFTDKDQQFIAEKIRYNFKTQKGKIYEVRTQQNELLIVGGAVRYESSKSQRDSLLRKENDVAFSENALITTCNHEHPHFGIRSRKIKVIPDKLAVIGPSRLELGGITLPIGLPFGFFPIAKGQRQGVLFPRDYEFSPLWGFGVRNIGYYLPIGEHFDAKILGDIYTRGTWRLGAVSSYVKRYKYTGSFDVEYSNLVQDVANSAERAKTGTLTIRWNHRQDSRAHPSQTFGGGVNFQTNNAQRLNYNDANSVFNNQLSSNMTYSKNFIGTPFNLTASLNHSQNTATRQVQVDFPTVTLTMRQIYPFKSKTPNAQPKWYENIGVTYNFNSLARVSTIDSIFLKKETLDKIEYGAKHDISVNAPFQVLKYFNVTPSIGYAEKWFFKTVEKYFDPTPVVKFDPKTGVRDTTAYGQVLDRRVNGFAPLRELTQMGVSVGTKVFGTLQFKRGWLRGLRHLATPTASFNFTPDYTSSAWGYFKTLDQTDTRPAFNKPLTYSVFSNNNILNQPSNSGKSMSLNFGLSNVFEAKYISRKDTIEPIKKIVLAYINAGMSYNMAADSLRWSQLTLSGNTPLFKGLSTLTYSMALDPYAVVASRGGSSQRINQLQWDKNRQLMRFERFDLGINTTLSANDILEWLGLKEKNSSTRGSSTANERQQNDLTNNNSRGGLNNGGLKLGSQPDNNNNNSGGADAPLISDVRFSHQFSLSTRADASGKTTTTISSNSLTLSGTINLSDKWKIGAGQLSYDFKAKRLIYPDLSFYRDLHCWEMGMSWQPDRGTYAFFLRVKPSALDFIKIPYNKNNFDANFGQ